MAGEIKQLLLRETRTELQKARGKAFGSAIAQAIEAAIVAEMANQTGTNAQKRAKAAAIVRASDIVNDLLEQYGNGN